MPPQPMDSWGNNTWDGQAVGEMYFGGYSPACPQIGYLDDPVGHILGPYAVDENCLYLNVYTPSDITENSNYAVMIWIYGGSFLSGWNTQSGIYDPSEIIDYIGDVIIVSINYRVGLFGSLYDNMYQTGITGNQGFLDQKMAIEWVFENIEYFGGDPSRITIFGESAGLRAIYINIYTHFIVV